MIKDGRRRRRAPGVGNVGKMCIRDSPAPASSALPPFSLLLFRCDASVSHSENSASGLLLIVTYIACYLDISLDFQYFILHNFAVSQFYIYHITLFCSDQSFSNRRFIGEMCIRDRATLRGGSFALIISSLT